MLHFITLAYSNTRQHSKGIAGVCSVQLDREEDSCEDRGLWTVQHTMSTLKI